MEMTHVIIIIKDNSAVEYTRTNDEGIALAFSNIYWLRKLGADALLVVELATGEIIHQQTEFCDEYLKDNELVGLINNLFTF